MTSLPSRALASVCTAAAVCCAGSAAAGVLYGNFDPASPTPSYSSSAYADLSGACGNPACAWINGYSASFTFEATASGRAAHAYLPMLATYTTAGAERIYGLTISNDAGEIVARGGFYGRDAPIGVMQIYEFDLFADTHAGQAVPNGVLAGDAPALVAGATYTVHFGQTYGSMSGARWMMSSVVPGPGQAQIHCATNGGGYCAAWNWAGYWDYPLGYSFTAPMTGFLPALVITDGSLDGGGGASGTGTVPEPSTAALLLGAMLAAGVRRRRTGGQPGPAARPT